MILNVSVIAFLKLLQSFNFINSFNVLFLVERKTADHLQGRRESTARRRSPYRVTLGRSRGASVDKTSQEKTFLNKSDDLSARFLIRLRYRCDLSTDVP